MSQLGRVGASSNRQPVWTRLTARLAGDSTSPAIRPGQAPRHRQALPLLRAELPKRGNELASDRLDWRVAMDVRLDATMVIARMAPWWGVFREDRSVRVDCSV